MTVHKREKNPMKSYRVGITGFHSTDSLKPGLNVARSLKEALNGNVKILSIESYPICPSLGLIKLVDEAYLIPAPAEGPLKVLDSLKELINKTDVDVIIPNDDDEVSLFCEIRDEIRALGVELLIPPPDKVFQVSKEGLYSFGSKKGYWIPFTQVFHKWIDFENNNSKFKYPFLLKGALSDVYLAYSKDEAKVYFDRIIQIWDPPVIVQDFIQGEEYSVVALADRESNMVGAVAMKKFGINEKGTTWSGATISDHCLLDLAENLIKDLQWVGPLEIEVIKKEGSNEPYIIEINPRFPAWIYLATRAGQNLPLALVQIATGEKVEKLPPYKSGVMFMRTSSEAIFRIERLGQLMVDSGVTVE
jgi:carbamoyl-phosphate synthase large subunit